MDTRWGTDGRSVLLVNNPQTLHHDAVRHGHQPARDAERDRRRSSTPRTTSSWSISRAHGTADDRLAAEQPPLVARRAGARRAQAAARRRRHQVADHRRVRVLLRRLRRRRCSDDYTLVVTDAQADRAIVRLRRPHAADVFGEAFFQQGLGKGDRSQAAFDAAKARVAEREQRRAGYTPPSEAADVRSARRWRSKMKSLRSRGARRQRPPCQRAGADRQTGKPWPHPFAFASSSTPTARTGSCAG